jgi:hypothetical protein
VSINAGAVDIKVTNLEPRKQLRAFIVEKLPISTKIELEMGLYYTAKKAPIASECGALI